MSLLARVMDRPKTQAYSQEVTTSLSRSPTVKVKWSAKEREAFWPTFTSMARSTGKCMMKQWSGTKLRKTNFSYPLTAVGELIWSYSDKVKNLLRLQRRKSVDLKTYKGLTRHSEPRLSKS